MPSNVTCHSCGEAMEATTGCYSWSCPGCEHIADSDGVQRTYSTGRPCDCPECTARTQARQRVDALSPGLRFITEVIVALARAAAMSRH
jgi:hypothetical protein